MGEYCRETQLRYHFAGIKGRRACRPRTQSGDGGPVAEGNEPTASKKQCLEESQDSDPEPLNEENVCFIRSNFIDGMDWRFFLSSSLHPHSVTSTFFFLSQTIRCQNPNSTCTRYGTGSRVPSTRCSRRTNCSGRPSGSMASATPARSGRRISDTRSRRPHSCAC